MITRSIRLLTKTQLALRCKHQLNTRSLRCKKCEVAVANTLRINHVVTTVIHVIVFCSDTVICGVWGYSRWRQLEMAARCYKRSKTPLAVDKPLCVQLIA